MIRILIDGSEYCEMCHRRCDSRCRNCLIYKNKNKEDKSHEPTISKTDGESKKG